jgi:fumarate reductase flavoprotein subunit
MTDEIVKYYNRNGMDWQHGVFHDDPTEDFDNQVAIAHNDHPNTIFIADTLEELAQQIGMDAQVLQATADEYNASCDLHYDDLFLKDRKFLNPIRGKRFYALKFVIGAYGSLGGIKINYKLQVLDNEYKWIKGFFGAGTDVCDIYAGTYCYNLAGNTMGFAINSGRLAGEYAAEYINSL